MDFKSWEKKEINRMAALTADLETAYFRSIDPNERKEILIEMIEKEGESEKTNLLKEAWEYRYIPKPREEQEIDHAMWGWLHIEFLPGIYKSFISKRSLPKKIDQIFIDMGKPVFDKYGELGAEMWKMELYNIILRYIDLCRKDKTYGSVVVGIGTMKESKLISKIAMDVVNVTYKIPKDIKALDRFDYFRGVARKAFRDTYPAYEAKFDEYVEVVDGKRKMED